MINLMKKLNRRLFDRSKSTTCVGEQEKKLKEALQYCVQIVRQRDYENYLAALLMPKSAQPRVFTILALNAEIATLRHKIKKIRRRPGLSAAQANIAEINQLVFWKDALEIFGQATTDRKGLLPRQPVMSALNAVGDRADLSLLLNLVKARQQTLGDRPFDSVGKLEQNSRQLYGSLILLQMRALLASDPSGNAHHFPNEAVQNAVDAMASAVGIITLLRATVLLLRDEVVLLPRDVTTLHGISDVMAYRDPNSLKPVVRDLCEISADHLRTARSATSIRPELRAALLTSGLRTDYVLSVLRGDNQYNLLDARLHRHHPLAAWKLWWRNTQKRY